MAYSPIAFIAPNYRDYKNWWLKAYEPATTTPKAIALESNGGTQVAKLQLNTDGFLESAGGAIVMPYIDGSYDAYLFPTEVEADSNDTSNAVRVADDITGVRGSDDYIAIKTLADAVADTSAQVGDYVRISDRGNTLAKYITATTNDGIGIMAAVGSSLQIIHESNTTATSYGADLTGITDSAPVIQYIADLGYTVLMDDGLYTLDAKISNTTALKIKAVNKWGAKLKSNHIDSSILSAETYLFLDGLFIEGNATGTQDGVYGEFLTNPEIKNCKFDKIGDPLALLDYNNPIQIRRSTNVKIKDNVFLADCYGQTSSDIQLGYSVSGSIVTGNISISDTDNLVATATVSYVPPNDTIHHIISNNIAIRKQGSLARHGCIIAYNSFDAKAIVDTNIFIGFNWTGVYIQSSTAATPPSIGGGAVITDNLINYCGGDDSGVTGTISAGIWFGGEIGGTCSGNLILNQGYRPDGTERDFPSPGIMISSYGSSISITGNTIKDTTSNGFRIQALGSPSNVDLISFDNNIISGCKQSPVYLLTSGLDYAKTVSLCGNNIKHLANGLSSGYERVFDIGGTTSGVAGTIKVDGNNILGDATTVAAMFRNDSILATFKNNTVEDCGTGVITGSFQEILGFGVTVSDNEFINVGDCYQPLLNGDLIAIVGMTNRIGTTPAVTDNNIYDKVSGTNNLILRGNIAPTSTRFNSTDIVYFRDPVTAGNTGARFNGAAWVNF